MRLHHFLTAQPLEPPRLRLLQVVDGFKVYEVDGEWVRAHIEPDFSSFGQHLHWEFVPEGELWVDHEEHADDWSFYVKRMLAEHALMGKGFPYEEAKELGGRIEQEERTRALPPGDAQAIKVQKLGVVGELTVWIVNGKAVRDSIFVDFKEGGHHLVYPWVPDKEIWIDDDLKPHERKVVILHELAEYRFMEQGWSYLAAHTQALEREVAHRKLPGAKIKIVPLPFTRQSTSFSCGAAALQSVLAYYGSLLPEDQLIPQLKTTDKGTYPEQISQVAQQHGLRSRIMEDMDLIDLQRMLGWGVPVIVAYQAWQEGKPQSWDQTWDDGHYSTIMGVDEHNVYLDDPSVYGAVGRIPRAEFEERWHDVDPSGRKRNHLGISCYKPGWKRGSVVREEKIMKVSQYLRMAETDIVISPNSILRNLEDRLSGMSAQDLEPSPGSKTGDPAKLTGVFNDKKFRIDISIKNGEAFIKVQYNESSISKTFSPLEVARIPFWVSSILI